PVPEDFCRQSGNQGAVIVPNRERNLLFLHGAGVLFVETYQTGHEICGDLGGAMMFWRDRKHRIVHAQSIVFSEPSRSCHGLICFVVSNPFRVQGSDASRSLTSEILDARRIRSASRVPSSGPTSAATPSSKSASMNFAWAPQPVCPSRGLESSYA